MSANPLKDIREEVLQTLRADAYFSNITLLTEERGDVLNRVLTAIGKLGLAVVIEPLHGKPENLAAGSYRLDLSLGVTVTENVLVNQGASGTKKPAEEVLARILCLLNPLRSESVPAWVESFDLVDDAGGLLVYQINCKAAAGFKLTE